MWTWCRQTQEVRAGYCSSQWQPELGLLALLLAKSI